MEQCECEWGTGCRGLSWHEPAYAPDPASHTVRHRGPQRTHKEGHSHRSTGVTPSPPGPAFREAEVATEARKLGKASEELGTTELEPAKEAGIRLSCKKKRPFWVREQPEHGRGRQNILHGRPGRGPGKKTLRREERFRAGLCGRLSSLEGGGFRVPAAREEDHALLLDLVSTGAAAKFPVNGLESQASPSAQGLWTPANIGSGPWL